MAQGRCCACGFIAPIKKAQKHIMTCAPYAELYKRAPGQALEPGKEFDRWTLEENNEEIRMANRAEKYAGYRSEADRKLAKSRERWANKPSS